MKFVPFKASKIPVAQTTLDESSPRVLYIEDEDINWEIAQMELESRFRLERARDAREAFALLAQKKYHLILMDIQLSRSELDGLAITTVLKGLADPERVPEFAKGIQAYDTPIIFLTAYSARYTKQDVLEAGGEDLIPKPVNFTHLSLVIARLWARGRPPTTPPPPPPGSPSTQPPPPPATPRGRRP